MHGEAAGRALARRGRRRPARLAGRDRSTSSTRTPSIVAVPPPEAARLLGREPPALEDSPIVSVHLLFDRPILDHRLAALLDSPAHWVFDRGALTGHEPPGGGQYLTVVSSGVPELLEVRGQGLVDLIGRRADATGSARPSSSGRASAASRARPSPPGPGRVGCGGRCETSQAERLPRGRVGRLGLAGDDGGGGSERRRRGAGGERMTAVEELTRLDPPSRRRPTRLLELQHPGGWWVGELESNATMVAEHLFWLHVLGLRDPDTDRRLANDILARRRDDGTWSNWWEGPADLSTTIESYVALKMAGVDAGREDARLHPARGRDPAAAASSRSASWRCSGSGRGSGSTPIPPELILLPPSAPFSVYNFACWARQTVVPLSVVWALRPVRPPTSTSARSAPAPASRSAAARPGAPPPPRDRRRRALGEGAPGGGRLVGRDPAAVGLVDRHARRARPRLRGRDAPPRRRGLGRRSWSRTATACGPRPASRRSGTPRSPCSRSATPASPPTTRSSEGGRVAARRGGDGRRATGRSAAPTSRPAAGRSSSRTTSTPTSTTPPSSRSPSASSGMGEEAVRRGLDWIEGMQSANGGWGAFDADNSSYWLYKLPFCDFGYVIDPPSEDVSAHALEALAPEPRYAESVARGPRVPPRRAAVGRLLVGPLGREPRLRHRGGRCRRSRRAVSSASIR